MNWEDVSKTARDTMDELGGFGPTVHADAKELKGYKYDNEGVGKCYWSSADLRRIAASCIEVADWLDKRANPEAYLRTIDEPESVNAELLEALLNVARMAEALKQPCGTDPESRQAIRNGKYMSISYAARAAIARAESAIETLGEEW